MKKIFFAGLAAFLPALLPFAAFAQSVCKVNGEVVPCDQLPAAFQAMFALFPLFFFGFWAAIILLVIVPLWIVFTKAGKPGWAAIVPVYNMIVMLEISGQPLWWIFLYFVPFVNLIIAVIVTVRIAEAFGKGAAFAVGMIFLPFVFYPILAFGSAQHKGVSARQS